MGEWPWWQQHALGLMAAVVAAASHIPENQKNPAVQGSFLTADNTQ
jgi:hypothetical protein